MDEPRESAREDPEGRRAAWLRNGGLRSTGKDEGNGPASESQGQEVSREWHARHRSQSEVLSVSAASASVTLVGSRRRTPNHLNRCA